MIEAYKKLILHYQDTEYLSKNNMVLKTITPFKKFTRKLTLGLSAGLQN